jgi:hypothetical protein
MSKPEWFGLAILGAGAIFGFVAGGPVGLALSAVCLIVGLVLCVASVALGITRRKPTAHQHSSSVHEKSPVLVLVKEVHARPQHNGKFQEIRDLNQADLQFEIFVRVWLINDTDQHLGIKLLQLSITKPDGAILLPELVFGDLGGWRFGRLKDEPDSSGVHYLHAAHEHMPELGTSEPLQGGETREGWLHFRTQNITPAQIKNAIIEVSVKDDQDGTHLGCAHGPHHVPGRVWPFQGDHLRPAAEVQHTSRNQAPRPSVS